MIDDTTTAEQGFVQQASRAKQRKLLFLWVILIWSFLLVSTRTIVFCLNFLKFDLKKNFIVLVFL